MKGMIFKEDPFQRAEKWIKLKLKEDVDEEELDKFMEKMKDLKENGYFLNWI